MLILPQVKGGQVKGCAKIVKTEGGRYKIVTKKGRVPRNFEKDSIGGVVKIRSREDELSLKLKAATQQHAMRLHIPLMQIDGIL